MINKKNRLLLVFAVFFIAFFLQGCSGNDKQVPNEAGIQDKLQAIQQQAQVWVEAGNPQSDIQPLMKQLLEHIDNEQYGKADQTIKEMQQVMGAETPSTPPINDQDEPPTTPHFGEGMIVCSERIVSSPDAKTSQIFTYAADGSNKQQLTTSGFNILPSWSHDGTKIYYSATEEDTQAMNIWVMNADGSNKQQITFNNAGNVQSFTPIESPDGARIAFTKKIAPAPADVYVMNVDGSNEQQLTTTKDINQEFMWSIHPSWSPDGEKITYSSTDSGSTQIWVMDADGSNKQQLTDGLGENYPDANVPVWSYDGSLITFWAGFEKQYGEVWTINPDGSNPQVITDTPDPKNSDDPSLSPDGTTMLYGSNKDGGDPRKMFILDLETGAEITLDGVHWCTWQPL